MPKKRVPLEPVDPDSNCITHSSIWNDTTMTATTTASASEEKEKTISETDRKMRDTLRSMRALRNSANSKRNGSPQVLDYTEAKRKRCEYTVKIDENYAIAVGMHQYSANQKEHEWEALKFVRYVEGEEGRVIVQAIPISKLPSFKKALDTIYAGKSKGVSVEEVGLRDLPFYPDGLIDATGYSGLNFERTKIVVDRNSNDCIWMVEVGPVVISTTGKGKKGAESFEALKIVRVNPHSKQKNSYSVNFPVRLIPAIWRVLKDLQEEFYPAA
jgi:hypothetical protein